MPITVSDLIERKLTGPPITVLTAYDYPTARILDDCGIDIILVGDSVGTNILGYDSERSVTLNDIIHHTKAVRRGTKNALLMADLPFQTYETPEQAEISARLLFDAGADCVKIESSSTEIIRAIKSAGSEVCSHAGLMPQVHNHLSVKGKTHRAAEAVIISCAEAEAAGAQMLLLELIPRELASIITRRASIPTIGIGAGPDTTGQVLVINDILGVNPKIMRHSARYAEFGDRVRDAVLQYTSDVRDNRFPLEGQSKSMDADELLLLNEWLLGYTL